MAKEKLENILKKVDIDVLKNLKEYILKSKEYKKLFRCTQMRDEVLRDDNDNTTNRGLHTIQVATNAQKLAKYLLERKNGQEFSEEYEKVLNEEEQKQVLIAEIIGLAHDLGHLPMAHASEVVCGEKIGNGYRFGHDQYGGVVFTELFERFKNQKIKGFDKFTLDEKTKLELENSGLKDYIIEGVQNHAKYLSYQSSERAREDLPLICGRLADTLSFMPSDIQGLAQVNRADGIEGKILSKDIIMRLLEEGITTTIGVENTNGIKKSEDLPTEKIVSSSQTLASYYAKNNPDFNYEKVMDDLISGDPNKLSKIQAQVLKEVAVNNVKENGEIASPLVSIPDNLKLLREAEYKLRGKQNETFKTIEEIPWALKEYEKNKFSAMYLGEQGKFDEAFRNYLESNVMGKSFTNYQDTLNQETNRLSKSCPTLAVLYEVQDELIYNQLLDKSTRVLGNDEIENKKVLSAIFDKYEKEYLLLDDKEKAEFEKTYQIFKEHMSLEQKGVDYTKKQKEGLKAKAYAAYHLQKLVNDDVDQERETRDFLEAIINRDFSQAMKARANAKEIGNYQEEAIAHSEGFEILEQSSEFEQIFKGLSTEQQERQKRQLIEEQTADDKIEMRRATKSIPDYMQSNVKQLQSSQRVAVFGIDAWKKIIGDRTIANLQNMALKIKNSKNRQVVQVNGIDTVDVFERD